MTKKDRIAIVLTIPFLIVSLLYLIMLFIFRDPYMPILMMLFLMPAVVYWGYRFIKGDISFMK